MGTRERLTGLFLAVVATALGAVATALPAYAHAELVSSDPAAGATLQTLPASVRLTFSEAVRAPAFVEVTGPGDTDVATGDVRIVDDRLTQRLGESAGGGSYAVSYRITSADGHAISGTVPFTLAGAGGDPGAAGGESDGAGQGPATPPGQSAAADPEESGGGMATGQLVLLLGALAVGLAALAIGTRRALRHSVTMVEERRGGRPSRR